MSGEAPRSHSVGRLATLIAPAIVEALDAYREGFDAVTRRASERFERRDWPGAVADAVERLELYGQVVGGVEAGARARLGPRATDPEAWAGMKGVYSGLIAGRDDREIAESFYNSVTRRIFATVGVDAAVDFVDSDFDEPRGADPGNVVRQYPEIDDPANLVDRALADAGFDAPFRDRRGDARLAGARLQEYLAAVGGSDRLERAEMVRSPFFRRKGAYLVGRVFSGGRAVPLALALLNTERGIEVDAVLLGEDDLSVLFSFTRSHFHVDVGPPHALVRFLQSLMPQKPVAELYITIGYHKHGKTELYRDLLAHLRSGRERFERAPGTPGLVMVVFTLPGHDVVFKVIRDRFPATKWVTRDEVMRKYRLVFQHDRAGRLVEAQEFEHLKFDRSRFAPELVEELEREATMTVSVQADAVVVSHAYVERRVEPLDLFVREAPDRDASAAVADFGQALKDLAATNIFPGDLLPKNFGLTRHGRVVCYDYDELGLITDFNFRAVPASRNYDDELGEEAWFGAGPSDVFPEEFPNFVSLPTALRATLEESHGDLYRVAFWEQMQARVRSGEVVDIFPYPPSRRLDHGA
jgi:isocitrate dehydrogenase kinase/phosphatase